MPRGRTEIVVAVALLLLPRTAAASDPPTLFEERPTTVYAQLGLGTPLGWGGVEWERVLTRYLTLSSGVGMGFAGPQAAVMPRLLLGNRHSAAFLGAGLSYGHYRRDDSCLFDCAPATFQGTVAWANFESGAEHRWESGLALRVFVGFAHIVAGDLACSGSELCSWDKEDVRRLVYIGTALGWSF